jgi:hypothetical protein
MVSLAKRILVLPSRVDTPATANFLSVAMIKVSFYVCVKVSNVIPFFGMISL